jgi:hypothetical protein
MEITKENLEKFFKEIKEKIIEAVKDEFPKMRKEFANEKPYAIAFETDSDCVTLSLIVNTYEFLEKKDTEYAKLFEDDYDDSTKWFPGDWGYWDGNNSGLVKIADELFEKVSSIWNQVHNQNPHLNPRPDLTDDQIVALHEQTGPIIGEYRFFELFFETVTSVFLELIQSGIFGFNPDEVTYFITMSDDDRAEEIENNSAKVLNSEKVYKEFLKRCEGVEL